MTHEGSENFNGDHHVLVEHMDIDVDGYTKFRVIRNPYTWLVTCWLRNNPKSNFSQWILSAAYTFQQQGTLFWRYKNQADIEIRFESLCLDEVLTVCKAPLVKLGKIGVTNNKPKWEELLTVASAKQLEQLFKDVTKYGYSIFI